MTLKRRLLALLLYGVVSSATGGPSLCDSTEQVLFACTIKGSAKHVALCGSRPLGRDTGYLQYRFGRPGAVELEFPPAKPGSPQQFQLAHYLRYRVDRTKITFANGGYQYVLYDDYEGDQKTVRRMAGVTVTGPGDTANTVDLVCGDTITSRLTALEGVVPCEADSDLNLGGCR